MLYHYNGRGIPCSSPDVVTLAVPKKSRWGPVELEMKFGTSDAGCYLYTDAETGSANGEIRAPARKSTLYRGPRCQNFRLIARIVRRKVDKNNRMFYRTSLPNTPENLISSGQVDIST